MLYALLLELLIKITALLLVVRAAHYLTTTYVDALVEVTATYIQIIDLLRENGRAPARFGTG